MSTRTATPSLWGPPRGAVAAACLTLAFVAACAAGRAEAQAGPAPLDSLRAEVARAETAGDSAALASAHNGLGLQHWEGASFDSAMVHLTRARDLWTGLADSSGLGRVHNNLGVVQYQWGNLEPALQSYLTALAIRRALGDARGVALVLANVGRAYGDWGLFDRALPALDEAVAVADQLGDTFVRGYTRHVRGMVRLGSGVVTGARTDLEASLAIYQAPESGLTPAQVRSGWGLNTAGLALVLVREGDPRAAIELLEEVFGGSPQNAATGRQVPPLLDLAEAYRAAGELGRARAALERASELSGSAGQRMQRLAALRALAEVSGAQGRLTDEVVYLRAHDALRDSIQAQSAVQQAAAMDQRTEVLRQAEENRRLRVAAREQELILTRQRATAALGGGLLVVSLLLVGVLVAFNRSGRHREHLLEVTNRDLREALSEVRTLKGLIPICSRCKKVRDDDGFWESVEKYVSTRSEAMFSHGICSECGPLLYGDAWEPEGERDPGAEDRASAAPAEGGTGEPRTDRESVDL